MSKAKNKNNKVSKTSSGKSRMRRANRERRELESKAKRWKRRQEEIKAGKRQGDLKRWDTAGLEKRIAQLKGIINEGPTRRV